MKKHYLSLHMSPIDVSVEGMICGSNGEFKENVDQLVNKNAEPTTLENFEISF